MTFAVSGMLWNLSLVMVDVETKSQWSHSLGKAMAGKLEGTELKAIVSDLTTWEDWLKEHPDTTVLNLSRTSNSYDKDFYRKPEDFVYGFIPDGHPYSVSFKVLHEITALNVTAGKTRLLITFDPDSTSARLFSRRVGDRTLEFESVQPGRVRDKETGTVWNSVTGIAVEGVLKGLALDHEIGIVSYARAWHALHPDDRNIEPSPPAEHEPKCPSVKWHTERQCPTVNTWLPTRSCEQQDFRMLTSQTRNTPQTEFWRIKWRTTCLISIPFGGF